MAAGAVVAKLTPMPVLVATQAVAPEAEEGMVQVLDLDFGARAGGNLLLVVTRLTFLLVMRAFQHKSGLGSVIEARAIQASEDKSTTVMFHMAAHTIDLSIQRLVGASVKARVGSDPPADFRVTIETLEAARTGAEIVARGAPGHTLQLLVGSR